MGKIRSANLLVGSVFVLLLCAENKYIPDRFTGDFSSPETHFTCELLMDLLQESVFMFEKIVIFGCMRAELLQDLPTQS